MRGISFELRTTLRSALLAVPLAMGALPLFAQPTVTVAGATQTQAAMSIRNYSGSCTIAVSESPSLTPLHPDVNPAEYLNSNIDTGRADTITQSNGARLVTIGHMNDDRALAAFTTYYWQVSGCGGSVTGSFSTATLSNGSTQQWPAPFNFNNPWNFGYPQVNLLNPAPVVDPVTGVKIMPVNSAADWGWRTGGGPNGLQSSYTAFAYWSGGSGWSNPGNIVNQSTSNATTSNTNSLDLYALGSGAYPADPWNGISVDDLGIVPWGSATNSTGNNNQITLCIFTSPSAGCQGTPVRVTLPTTFGQVMSGSSDPDQPFPAAFPAAFFAGWGLTAPLGPDHVNTNGTLSCTASVCTIMGPTRQANFPSGMAVGQKIYIAGSSPTCTNNLCTLASYQGAAQITIAESLTISGANFITLMWGVRVQKASSTGSVTVGLAFKQAGARGLQNQGANSGSIASASFTSGDGHVGFLAVLPTTAFSGISSLYFVSGDGTARRLWSLRIPSDSSCFSPAGANNQPTGQNFTILNPSIAFSPTNPKLFYLAYGNAAGSTSIYAVTYTGDAFTNIPPDNYSLSMDGNVPLYFSPCDQTSWVNLLPPTSGFDLNSQIATNAPGYNAALYGTSFTLAGVSGTTAFFSNNYSGQNYPAWIAVVDLSQNPAKLVNMIHTLDGTGTTSATTAIGPAAIRWGGHHNGTATNPPNTLELTEDSLTNQNSSVMFSGPFQAVPVGLLEADGVTWNSNTSLPWPPDNSYYTQCPSGNPYAAWNYATAPGGTGVANNCVTLRFPVGGVCNAYPSSTEKANFPACPWNSSFTQPVALAVGDNFGDPNTTSACGIGDVGDCEHFRIVQITTEASPAYVDVVAMRNAIYDYCSYNPTYFPGTPVNNGLDSPGQVTHLNGWTAVMLPSRLNGCATGTYYYTYSASGSTIQEEGRLQAGHGQLAPGITSGNYSLIANSAAKTNVPFSQMFSLPTQFYSLIAPTFQGNALGIGAGAVQSYVNSPGGVPWMVDANAMNGNFGLGSEVTSNTIGTVTLTNVSGNVYSISPLTNNGNPVTQAAYKTWPLLGWAGRYLLHNVSGPSSSIALSPWGICYAYAAGECVSGSMQGSVYVNVPGAYNSGSCNTGQSFLLAPCVITGFPSGGGFRLQIITQPDTNSQGSVLLGYGLTAPGEHYPYTEGNALPDGSAVLLSGHQTQGWGTMSWLVRLPPLAQPGTARYLETDRRNRSQFEESPVQIQPGLPYAEVQFGYSRFIGANTSPAGNFFCTARADGCNTSGTPYNFESETRTLTSCSGGCTINIPVMAPNLVYYRVRRSSDGVNWMAGDVEILARP